MPKIVCTECQTEFRPETNGVIVIEVASFGPYKVWNADLLKCPGCGAEVVAGFAHNPLRQDHWSDDFPAWLERIKQENDVIVYDYESPQEED